MKIKDESPAVKGRPARNDPVPNYFSRREQRRLLLLVMSLLAILFLTIEAAKPRNWAWFFGGTPTVAGGGPVEAREWADERVDTRFRPDAQRAGAGIPDAFVLVPSGPPPEAEPRDTNEGFREEGYFPGVQPDLLATVRDNAIFRAAETEAWFHLLGILKDNARDDLAAASLGRVGFLQLYKQPDEYRGKLVTIRGSVRRCHRLESPKNDYDITEYWQCYLYPAGGPDSPIVVYFVELPEGFPIGMEIREDVELTGFFYKRWLYAAADSPRVAPLVLAKTPHWAPPVPPPAWKQVGSPEFMRILGAVLGVSTVLAIAIAWVVNRRNRQTVSATAEKYRPTSQVQPEQMSALGNVDSGESVGDRLRDMARNESDERT